MDVNAQSISTTEATFPPIWMEDFEDYPTMLGDEEERQELVSRLLYEKYSLIKRLNYEAGELFLELTSAKETKKVKNIKFGYRTRAKKLVFFYKGEEQQAWFPQVEINGVFVFIRHDEYPAQVVECTSRYLALKYARRFLARKHNNVL
jgi:ribosomal protein S17E